MEDKLSSKIERNFGDIVGWNSDKVGMAHEISYLKFENRREMVLKLP